MESGKSTAIFIAPFNSRTLDVCNMRSSMYSKNGYNSKVMFSQTAQSDNTCISDIEDNHRVIFGKPALPALTRSYTVVDLHFHSRYSDGFNSIEAIARRARKLGIGIAVTDHNAIGGAVEMARHKDILSIPGIEITAREGAHILAYFYTIDDLIDFFETDVAPWLGKNVMTSCAMSMESIISCVRKYNGLVVFPHPYCAVYTGVCNPIFSKSRQESLLAMADGVEVINAANVHRWNLKSTVLGFNMNTGLTAGSDGHNLFQMGAAVTYAACESNPTAFLDAVRGKMTWTMGKEVGLLRKVTSSSMKLRTNMNNTPDLFGKNMRYGRALVNSGSRKVRDRVHEKMERHRTLKNQRKRNQEFAPSRDAAFSGGDPRMKK